MPHTQVTVQPWGFQADTEIAGLLQRLNDRDMPTLFSCQGEWGNSLNPAYIMFEYLEHAYEFAVSSSEALQAYEFDIALFGTHTGTQGRVTFPNHYIKQLEGTW